MSDYFDDRETRDPHEREAELFGRLPDALAGAIGNARGWAARFADIDPAAVSSRDTLAKLPILRKADLMALQRADPPFGGFVTSTHASLGRIFMSPGPIYEPQGLGSDPFNAARALFAAGFRTGDLIHNTFAYHMTPGAWTIDEAARSLGATVFPAGTGHTEQQVEAIAALRPTAYCGVPDFLKILLDKADALGLDATSITKGMVSGAALPASLRAELTQRGVAVRQAYGTAELGIIAYESEAEEGLIVSEDIILEIVRPGTGEPVAGDEVGELVITRFSDVYPLFRLATGDLSASMPGASPCGRTGHRIRGWMGRADQRTKIKGMFVDPAQLAALNERFPAIRRLRLVVTRSDEQDQMVLKAEVDSTHEGLAAAIGMTLREVTKLTGRVELMPPGSLPNDGKVIADERVLG